MMCSGLHGDMQTPAEMTGALGASAPRGNSSDNNVNVWKGSLDVIEWDFLTSNTNAWFLLDMERARQFLNFYMRREAVLESDGYNFDTEVA